MKELSTICVACTGAFVQATQLIDNHPLTHSKIAAGEADADGHCEADDGKDPDHEECDPHGGGHTFFRLGRIHQLVNDEDAGDADRHASEYAADQTWYRPVMKHEVGVCQVVPPDIAAVGEEHDYGEDTADHADDAGDRHRPREDAKHHEHRLAEETEEIYDAFHCRPS